MAREFKITNQFPGYTNQIEETNVNPDYLGVGSKNVINTIEGSLTSRNGYILAGDAGSVGGIKNAYSYRTSRGIYHTIRKVGTTMQFLDIDKSGPEPIYSWITFATGLESGTRPDFDVVTDTVRKINNLIFVDGVMSKVYLWTGAVIKVASNTATTITKQGSRTWASLGFPATGNVMIGGTLYAYTGGTTSTTLTGLTSVPSLAVGSYVSDEVRMLTPTGLNIDNFTLDTIGVFRNQVYYGSMNSTVVKISKATDVADFTASSPRAIGDGNELNLDDVVQGFLAGKKSMLIFGQENSIFEIRYTASATQTTEIFEVERFETAPQEGLVSRDAKIITLDGIVYINKEKTMKELSFVQNLVDTRQPPLSDIVKKDFDSYDFTDSTTAVWDRHTIISVPKSNVLLMYNQQRKFWQVPMTFSGATIGCLSVLEDGTLMGHDYFNDTSYILFSGTSDNGANIESIAVFPYNNLGLRYNKKSIGTYVQDGYITATGDLKLKLDYEYQGVQGTVERVINASLGSKFVYYNEDDSGLGHKHLGETSLSGSSLNPAVTDRRFKLGFNFTQKEFYEMKVQYSMTGRGQWKLVAHGSDAKKTETEINDILVV
jgi:hypothetical protein